MTPASDFMSESHVSTDSVGHHEAISSAARSSLQILVVECDDSLRDGCLAVLKGEGYTMAGSSRGEDAIRMIERKRYDIILVNLFMSGVSGMKILETAKRAHKESLVILMTGNPSVETNIKAIQAGAWEYLAMPFTAEQLQLVVGKAAYNVLNLRSGAVPAPAPLTAQRPSYKKSSQSDSVIGISQKFCQTVELARKVARTNASVMISGESGTGKEVIAQLIHRESLRSQKKFVAINCAALPAHLLESEMFGHKKGAFTGADRDKPGLLEVAHGGTLFLDELTEMPLALQAKLLRVIQDGVVRRVGSEQEDAVVDVRFLSATNRELGDALDNKVLRPDLFYRLRVVPIHLPPLRERVEDIPLLANHFLGQYWKRHRTNDGEAPRLSQAVLDFLMARTWPGNVRELQNAIEHISVMAEPGALLQVSDLPLQTEVEVGATGSQNGWPAHLMSKTYHAAKESVLNHFETEYLNNLVARANRNMSKAARLAGVDRTTLYRLLDKHSSAPADQIPTGDRAPGYESESPL